MRTSTQTLLTLWEWSQIIGLNPFWVAQISENVPQRGNFLNAQCEHTMFQRPFQNFDFLGREEVALAIAQAEDLFRQHTGYYPAPKYITAEKHTYPRNFDRQYPIQYGMRDSSARFKAVQTRSGWIETIGTEVLTSIQTSAVTLSSAVGGTVMDTFTATATVPAGTSAAEIAAFFLPADRAGLTLAESEIKPLKVSVSGTTATITGAAMLLVLPVLQLAYNPQDLSATDTTIYADEIAVYTRTTDTTDTGTLIWENLLPCETPPCSVTIQTACFYARNQELGLVAPVPALWNTSIEQFSYQYPDCIYRNPDRLTVNYLAGYPRQDNGYMDAKHARLIALLATALLPQRSAGCNRADQRLLYYRDMPVENGNLTVPRDTMEGAGEAFSVMGRGACEAYLLMKPLIQYSSVNYA